jgi:hypothetical protein
MVRFAQCERVYDQHLPLALRSTSPPHLAPCRIVDRACSVRETGGAEWHLERRAQQYCLLCHLWIHSWRPAVLRPVELLRISPEPAQYFLHQPRSLRSGCRTGHCGHGGCSVWLPAKSSALVVPRCTDPFLCNDRHRIIPVPSRRGDSIRERDRCTVGDRAVERNAPSNADL